jgi:teichuronic acid biosynthesis glycosyltransferase TuaC
MAPLGRTSRAAAGAGGGSRAAHLGEDIAVLPMAPAAAQIRTSGAQIVVVGDGPERVAAVAAARRLGLADGVHFTGFRPHREIPAILGHADVFAMPSAYRKPGD